MSYTVSRKAKMTNIIFMVIGALSLVMGIMTDTHGGNTVWGNIMVNGYYFFGISVAATFF
ncbi:MAG: hypothetical protein IH948_05030, partial [Bacteroidetes bacterium]|nr:hypothetical protein [Bacteroidota bacterium]